jgi:hypothetical protein
MIGKTKQLLHLIVEERIQTLIVMLGQEILVMIMMEKNSRFGGCKIFQKNGGDILLTWTVLQKNNLYDIFHLKPKASQLWR